MNGDAGRKAERPGSLPDKPEASPWVRIGVLSILNGRGGPLTEQAGSPQEIAKQNGKDPRPGVRSPGFQPSHPADWLGDLVHLPVTSDFTSVRRGLGS